jgi:hypothetical protein
MGHVFSETAEVRVHKSVACGGCSLPLLRTASLAVRTRQQLRLWNGQGDDLGSGKSVTR